jgi:hypothetical protein
MAVTQQQLTLIQKNWQGALRTLVDQNPSGCYQLIQSRYPGEFPLMAPGLEMAQLSRNNIYTFLEKKAQLSGDPVKFVAGY